MMKIPTSHEDHQTIWNCDETAFTTETISLKVIAKRGAKGVYEVGGGSGREYITVHHCGSAAGQYFPPFILYKGKNLLSKYTTGGQGGCCVWSKFLRMDGITKFCQLV